MVVLVIDAIIAVVCVVGLYHVSQKAGIPLVLDEEEGNVRCVEMLDPAYQQYIKPGEYIRAVGGISVRRMEDVEFLLDARQIGENTEFLIDDGRGARVVTIPLTNYYGSSYIIIVAVVGLFFYLVGLFVYLKRPGDVAAILFHWGSMCAVIMMLTTWGRYTVEPVAIGIGLRAIFFLAHCFLSVIFFHFTFEFPKPKWHALRKYIGYLYSIALGLAIWTIVMFFRAVESLSLDTFGESLLAFFISRWFLVAFGLFGLLSIAHSYYIAVEEFERKKLRWVLWGLFTGFLPYLVLWVIPQILLKQGIVPEEVVTLFAAFIPLAFAISIVRYRLMDIDLIINRSIVYALVMGLVLGVYAGIVALSAVIVTSLTVESSMAISAFAAVVVALLFAPMRNKVQQFVDRRFFRVHYNFREAQRKFAEQVKHVFDLQHLAGAVVEQVDGFFAVERVGFFIFNDNATRLRLVAHKNFEVLASHGVRFETEKLRASLRVPVAIPNKIESGVTFEPADVQVFTRWGMAIVFAMLSERGNILGFLVLGPKKSGVRFTAEDADLLAAVSDQAGEAIERINLQQRLMLEHAETRRLEELNTLKSYFVSSVSHDLKTPLTSIKMFAEMLLAGKNLPGKRAKEYLQIIEGESERLTRLINNVLDFAKVERGMLEYQFDDVQLNAVVRNVLRSMKYQFKMGKCTINAKLNRKDLVIHADEDAVAEGLVNILSNALKYSKTSGRVAVSTFKRNGYAAVRVDDKGIGIARHDLRNIFEPFYRAKGVRGGEVGGAGLGLALVKHIVEAHKGKIEVHSTAGKGSSFTLLFPLGEKS